MDAVINTRLLAHPANWGIVWTVLLFGMVGFALLHKSLGVAAPVAS